MRDPAAVGAMRSDESPILFGFAYCAVPFSVVVGDAATKKNGGGHGVMLHANVGTMPFTADGPALRSRIIAVLDQARRIPGINVQVAPDHGICLTVALPVGAAAQPASVLAAALGRLVEAKPLLDTVLSLLPAHLRNAAGDRQVAA